MHDAELAQLELFAQVDELTRQLGEWSGSAHGPSGWEPLDQCRALIRRVLPRLEKLRVRLEAPLVVATFGGTGTGKSALINALVGIECSPSGRERPTTRRPVVICHRKAELSVLELPEADCELLRVDSPVLRDVVLIDCPDPDTNESASSGSNLEILRSLLPHCDALLCVSTQQKYRSARVLDELDVASTGCRLVFVQTHADRDEDIRDDWSRSLRERYEVPDLFFVDSLRALQEQRSGQRPGGDFSKLLDLLTNRLVASQRTRIRRANLLELAQAAVNRCQRQLEPHWPRLRAVESTAQLQHGRLRAAMTAALCGQLETCRHLWDQRILAAVTERLGTSPFSALLRVYGGLGALLASAGLFRARSGAQMLLVGAVQGHRWWSAKQREREAGEQFDQLGTLGIDESLLHEARILLRGTLADARLPLTLADSHMGSVNSDSSRLQGRFLDEARQGVEDAIGRLAIRNSGWFARCFYELMLLAFVGYILFRAGKNFFWDTFLDPLARILPIDFYFSALIFFSLWSGLLVLGFTRRLRSGLNAEIQQLASRLAGSRMGDELFPEVSATITRLTAEQDRLLAIASLCENLRDDLATTPLLGSRRSD